MYLLIKKLLTRPLPRTIEKLVCDAIGCADSVGRPETRESMIGVRQYGDCTVTAILNHIRSLEAYVERSGARLVRTALPECVCGQLRGDVITLRLDLSPEQHLLTLVHELVHLLQPHHPPAFWARVERAMPDFEQRKRWLAERGRVVRPRLTP